MTKVENERRAAAKAGYEFGYAMVENYRTLYAQAVDTNDSRFVGGFGVYRYYSQPARPENTDIVTPNNDTPYAWAWIDLRAEPWVVTVPSIDRYYILPFHDLYTIYAGYVGAATTGPGAGSYLLAGPSWQGTAPDGITGVIHSATDIVGTLTRTELTDEGVDSLRTVQTSYRLQPLSAFTNQEAPPPAPTVSWPRWDEHAFTATPRFFELIDFLLQFAPALPEDADARAALATLGVDGSGTFVLDGLEPNALADLQAGLDDGVAALAAAAASSTTSIGLFGTHAEMAGKYLNRNLGAMKGIYGLPTSEAWYGGWLLDAAGNHPIGAHPHTVTFTADQLPKVKFFWSMTMYRLPERLLVDNPIDRYSIGDRTPGLHYAADGSLTITMSHDEPVEPANWLPAPDGPFTAILRGYGGDESMVTGAYQLPPLTPT